MYVGKARENTDKKNMAEVERLILTANGDEAVTDALSVTYPGKLPCPNGTFCLAWNPDQAGNAWSGAYSLSWHSTAHPYMADGAAQSILDYANKVLPDGVIKSETKKQIALYIVLDDTGLGIKQVFCDYTDNMKTRVHAAYPDLFN